MAGSLQKRLSFLSESSECGDNRPLSPDGCNRSIKSFSSTSTLDSIALENSAPSIAPPLPARPCIYVFDLRKWPCESASPGWGVTLRGTTTELGEGSKIYTCHIESVQDNGAAKVYKNNYSMLIIIIKQNSFKPRSFRAEYVFSLQ